MNRRKFLNYIGCGCCNVLITSCSTVPITNRRQLKLIPEDKLNSQAAAIYEKVKKKEKLINDSSTLKEIKKIGNKMENAIDKYFNSMNQLNPARNFDWEYILIDNKKIANAWCMPGGKIAVYTGMLEITKNNNGLAAVMGHEIAHAVAKHSVERASRSIVLNTSTQLIDIFSGGKLSNVNRVTGMNTVGLLSQIGLMNLLILVPMAVKAMFALFFGQTTMKHGHQVGLWTTSHSVVQQILLSLTTTFIAMPSLLVRQQVWTQHHLMSLLQKKETTYTM